MIKNTKKGSHTIEAALLLPLLMLSLLSLGYIIRCDSLWENAVYCSVDECIAFSEKTVPVSPSVLSDRVEKRLMSERNHPDTVEVTNVISGYRDGLSSRLTSFAINEEVHMSLPVGFEKDVSFRGKLKYRSFCGHTYRSSGMGSEGLETYEGENPVWIFPRQGEKYHSESCTYVKATVRSAVLTSSLKRDYSPCGLCGSGDIREGSIVFIFRSENSAYHRSTCSSINRHTTVIDRSEAVERGYTPCSKCGGGAD